MNKKTPTSNESFADLFTDVKPFAQDKRHFNVPTKQKVQQAATVGQREAQWYFSDDYHPLLPSEGPMRWQRDDIDKMELKRLRQGHYTPELLLDVHGMRQAEAKLEIAALIQACVKQHHACCSIMHGFGTGILKKQIPMWLTQHPQIKAFHQAPKEWGGDAALLILIDIGDHPHWR